jgi:dihydroflavonol-4-reductase
MKCLVTGGTGFLGRHLVRLLLESGHSVRALVRRESLSLEREGAECVLGDVTEPSSLTAACAGVDVVFHLAGRVQHKGEPTALYHLHVEGTRNMLKASAEAGVGRFVHMSSSGTIAVSKADDVVSDETAPYATTTVRNWPYYLSKIFAEKVALDAHRRGRLPVVVLNPSLLLGPDDEGLSSSQILIRFHREEIAAIPPGGINFVDVRDVAAATVAAATQGAPGERYLLGGLNMTLEAFLVLLGKVTGVRVPTLKTSSALNQAAGRAIRVLEEVGGLTGDDSVAYEMAGHYWYLDARKAQVQLGFQPRAAEATIRDAFRWIRAQGPLPASEGTVGNLVRAFKRAVGRA